MAEYIEFPIETDPDVLASDAYDYLAVQVPGWLPSPGNFEAILLETLARMVAEARDVASDVPRSIFRYFGYTLAGIAPIDDVSATAVSTWTMRDTAGYTIPAGTTVNIAAAGDQVYAFQTVGDVTVLPGVTVTATGGVQLAAVLPGPEPNGLTADPELVDALDYVVSIELVGPVVGGVEAETDDAYLNRLSDELRLLAPRPILARDFAVLAKRIAGVDRALALDGYNPATATYNNERMVAVAVVDAAGLVVSGATKAAVDALLQSYREVNFVVNVIDPTYTAIDVTFTAVAYDEFEPADVEARAEAAVADYLSPANWGLPQFGDQRIWINEPVVRYLEVAEVINRVEGLHYVTALTVEGGTVDVALTGAAPLTTPGTIAGTVT